MSAVRRFLPASTYEGELAGHTRVEPDLTDADLRTRMVELGKAMGIGIAREDHDILLFLARLKDGRYAVLPDEPFAGAAYAIEEPL